MRNTYIQRCDYSLRKSFLQSGKISLLVSAFIASSTLAHAAPDAGSLSQGIEKQLDAPKALPQNQPLQLQSPAQKPTAPSSVKVALKRFTFSGNTLIKTEALQAIVAPYLGKKLSFDELQDVTRLIADYYRDKGYSARAFLPPQEVQDGIIGIIILEGKLSAIEVEAEATSRLDKAYAKNIIEDAHPTGATLEIAKIERGLLILGDTPGLVASSSLAAGENAGDSKLKVKLQDGPLFAGTLSYTNAGSKDTGSDQFSLSSALNNPFGLGDQATLQAMKTRGIDYGKVGYSIPVGYSGLRMGASVSAMQYEVVEGTDADGKANTLGLNASYPLVRTPTMNLTLLANYDMKSYLNRTSSVVISDKQNNVLSLALNASHNDAMGQTSYGISASRGKIDLSDSATDLLADEAAAQTHGDFTKWVLNASRYQNLTEGFALFASGSIQKSNKNLDSSEKLYLGGVSGIRAYPNSEAGGDEGWTLNLELIKHLYEGFTTSLFYDIGRITQHHSLYTGWQGAGTAGNAYTLKGYGATLGYTQGSFSAKATLAWKDGENPNPQPDGLDNDGTDKNPRIWVNLMKQF
jgi:hemolysin activation/secretion protein